MQNGALMSNFTKELKWYKGSSQENRAFIKNYRQKVMDYIYYSVLVGDGSTQAFGSCAKECGQGLFKQKCCAGIDAWMDQAQTQREFWYACVDQSLAAADINMNIAGISVAINCVNSGASRITALTAGAVLAAASLY